MKTLIGTGDSVMHGIRPGGPQTIADFFDLEKFPGKRGVKKGAKTTLEMALMADGVPASEVYEVLETDEGVDRAFAKLDEIKGEAVWWEAGSQPPQLLADGEVAMTMAWNGRIFNAAVAEDKPFEIMWDGQVFAKGEVKVEARLVERTRRFLSFAHTGDNRIGRDIGHGAIAPHHYLTGGKMQG